MLSNYALRASSTPRQDDRRPAALGRDPSVATPSGRGQGHGLDRAARLGTLRAGVSGGGARNDDWAGCAGGGPAAHDGGSGGGSGAAGFGGRRERSRRGRGEVGRGHATR